MVLIQIVAPLASRLTRNSQGQAQPDRAAQEVRPNLKPYLPGILTHCRFPLHTNLLEGINNKIKVIKRMAYGFRDDAYFFLKIRAAFPGVG